MNSDNTDRNSKQTRDDCGVSCDLKANLVRVMRVNNKKW
jgi:hypothetical protein